MRQYYVWMCNRGTATYKNGKIDFSHGEGGNNHIHIFDADGNEIGYLWFDTHIGDGMPKRVNEKLGFCGTGTSNSLGSSATSSRSGSSTGGPQTATRCSTSPLGSSSA